MNQIPIRSVSVKVMRSYDYCHFECTLGGTASDSESSYTLEEVDDLRKQAAVICDEAVRQYKLIKRGEDQAHFMDSEKDAHRRTYQSLKSMPYKDLSVDQLALLRNYEDEAFWKSLGHEDGYYQDPEDAEKDHHFSMLTKFKEARARL